ncbi:T-cell-specific surface glycoprotein CD28 homolog [Varanus komodoensis]|uniref:T-cell-specific surface glycoprotein CD28 homolog n=1 Tax=Varanus komodoensis TaxID=61221 RepID=UPI001CF7A1B2|nr:T-cell-specific surface glycoprotein CD28 homolog [Varanus komodoensis]
MNLDIVTFCFLFFHFEPQYGAADCSPKPSVGPCKENLSISTFQPTDEFPRENFTFNCSLPSIVQGFYMRLFKGRDKEAICTLYRDNGQNGTENKSEFCEPIYLGDKVSFRLWNLKSHHSDTYTCCLESLSPVFNCCKAGEKHLYIQESAAAAEEPCFFSALTSWILIGFTAFSTGACIFWLTLFCFRNEVCRRVSSSHDYNNEYMSMAAVKST